MTCAPFLSFDAGALPFRRRLITWRRAGRGFAPYPGRSDITEIDAPEHIGIGTDRADLIERTNWEIDQPLPALRFVDRAPDAVLAGNLPREEDGRIRAALRGLAERDVVDAGDVGHRLPAAAAVGAAP